MKDELRGALFQDNQFRFEGFDGLKLEQLIVCENPETKEIVLVFIKVENEDWHQYFLDFGYGFWHNYEDIDPIADANVDHSYNYIDKIAEFDLVDKRIRQIWCAPHENNSQIIVEFEDNSQLVLRAVEPQLFDSNSELILVNP